MDPLSGALAFAVPEWLAPCMEPNIAATVSLLGVETVRVRRFLADDLSLPRQGTRSPPWVGAFDLVTGGCAVERRNTERYPERWPR